MISADKDIRKRLVIAQQDIETWLQRFDQAGFEQKRFGFSFRDHEFHARGRHDHRGDALCLAANTRVRRHPRFEAFRLADIKHCVVFTEHTIHARLGWKPGEIIFDDIDAAVDAEENQSAQALA
eukprot:CAMPEP_0184473374 /NCGR_PEP_ID=MMETSP0740-20130409/122642_1 /TAXON_ID=385413 /ORGANISM="Thalassiosira miniscula, Strain CCMP1093" /LENGTH=123 /DNA_ID=CAMNT_0026850285 /DNA_START=101 /DNA_END=471 /DNA_ORIENTATION=-